jgi:hypothetical protein
MRSAGLANRLVWAECIVQPPSLGSSRARSVYGGAQRGISLASGLFTGESTSKPLGQRRPENRLDIRDLRNHDLARVDSSEEASEATGHGSHPGQKPPRNSTSAHCAPEVRERIDSTRETGLTFLAPLTYP